MATLLFQELLARAATLEATFLNFPTKDSIIPSNQDKIRAFILLMHSEFEFYFEQLADQIKTIVAAPALSTKDYSRIPTDMYIYPHAVVECEKEFNYGRRGEKVLQRYESRITKNNGIKERDILSLLLPLGVDYNALTTIMLNTLDSYGDKRGLFAHTGNRRCVSRVLDRDAEARECGQLTTLISALDTDLQKQHALP